MDAMRSLTVAAADLALLDEVQEKMDAYVQAVQRYAAQASRSKEALADTGDVVRVMQQGVMDSSSARLSEGMDAFIAAQLAQMNANVQGQVAIIAWVNDIFDLGNNARINNFRAQTLRDADFMRRAIENIQAMDTLFSKLDPKIVEPADRAALAELRNTSNGYLVAIEQYLITFAELEKLNNQRAEQGTQTLELVQRTALAGVSNALEIADDAADRLSAAEATVIVGVIIGLAMGMFLAYVIARSIINPLDRAITDLAHGSSESSSAAEQVSCASQSLAEGASEQAASLEETSSSMEQITSMVAHNADVAKETSAHARLAVDAANDGVRSMGELRHDADAVSASAKEMEEAMEAIKESSNSISKIIKTIDEIAFQTNILALNAAVEAARAGEAGAGFAVVADEVRSLAHRAAGAARETATLIEGSMERSALGVRVNQMVGQNLKAVLEKAEIVEGGLKSISNTVSEVASSMQGLEASVVEQQEGINQINIAIAQVNDVTQSNAASAEQAASAAEQMNAQAVSLMDIVGPLTLMVRGEQGNAKANANGQLSPPKGGPDQSRERAFSLPGD
jgi:methyl-accepting chemotaxis protein